MHDNVPLRFKLHTHNFDLFHDIVLDSCGITIIGADLHFQTLSESRGCLQVECLLQTENQKNDK